MNARIKLLTASAVLVLTCRSANAANFNLSLTGDVSNFNEYQFDSGNRHYDSFDLGLSGLDSTNAITVSQGDTVHASVALDSAYTIPMSPDHTDFLLYLEGSNFPAENTGNFGTFNFYNGAALVRSFTFGSTTSDQLSSYAAFYGANNTAFTFDSFTDDFTIDTLAQPATLDSSFLSYSVVSQTAGAVPEPATWAMMVGGFAVIGGSLRARRKEARLA